MQADLPIEIVAVTLLQNIHYAPLVINKLLISMATLVIVGGPQLHCSLGGHCSSRQLNLLGTQLCAISWDCGIFESCYSEHSLRSIGNCMGSAGEVMEGFCGGGECQGPTVDVMDKSLQSSMHFK